MKSSQGGSTMHDRAWGCLAGGAIGDAMGMPASFLTRNKIKETYGYIEDFLEPIAQVQTHHGNLQAGQITDDTQESIIAEVLIEQGAFNKEAFAEKMRLWAIENKMLESTVIGPSTRRFLTALIEGKDPSEGAKISDTNGSAMRVAPVGIHYYHDFDLCAKVAAESSIPSHGSAPAVAAACAVAVACAAGIRGGFKPDEVMMEAIKAAEYGESIGFDIPAPSISKRIGMAKRIVDEKKAEGMNAILDELVGIFGASMKSYESIPIALGVFYAVEGDAKQGIIAAVNGGDDADTNASICGAICGAYSGITKLPKEWISRVEKTSCIDFRKMASQLIEY
jgi:ADP-ribosylglycohydrolase